MQTNGVDKKIFGVKSLMWKIGVKKVDPVLSKIMDNNFHGAFPPFESGSNFVVKKLPMLCLIWPKIIG